MSHPNMGSFNPSNLCECCLDQDCDFQQKKCEKCMLKDPFETNQFLFTQSYQDQQIEFNNDIFQEEQISHIFDKQEQHQSISLQLNNLDIANQENPFINQQEIHENTQFDQQNFIQFKEDINNYDVLFQNEQQCEKDQQSQNQLNCFSTQFPNTQLNLVSPPASPHSIKSFKSQETSSISLNPGQQDFNFENNQFNNKINKDIQSSSSIKSKSQSAIKNNIRDFLTPIIRMKNGYVDYQLLEKENLSSFQYQNFLKKHFCLSDSRNLKIRQQTFDTLFDPTSKDQLKEKKVLALISIKVFQQQFMKLIIEKRAQWDENQFKLQFDWINSINDTLIFFLNSISI